MEPTYFTHQNAQTRYYSTVLFYKKQVVIRKIIINAKANKYHAKPDDFTIEFY